MHELSIAQSICRSVRERVGEARVLELVVEVGALSGVNCASLEFCLGEAARLAGMALARFDVQPVAARMECDCGCAYEADDLMRPCPRCGGFARSVVDGEDVIVSRLVVETDDDAANDSGQDRH